MKKLLAPVLLLIVTGVGVAWYALAASLRAEREYTAFVHALADGDSSSRVLDSSFERGWLGSRAETSIEVAGGAGLAFRSFVTALGATDVRERVGIHMVHSIDHGPLPLWEWIAGGMHGAPILARIHSTVEIDNEAQLELAEAVGKLPPVEALTVLRAGGQATAQLSVASQRLRARGEGFTREARFLGATGELELRDGYRYLSGTLQSPGFEGRGLERAVELRDVTFDFELPGSELPVGRMGIEIGALRVAPAQGAGGVALEDVAIEPSGRLAGGRLEADLLLRVRSLALGAESFGPVNAALDLRDLDAAAFRRLRRAGLRLQDGRSDPAATAVAAGELAEALPVLLDRGPRAELRELHLGTPAGPVAARGSLALARPDLSAGSLTVGSFFDGSLEAEAPPAAADTMLAAVLAPASVAELRAKGALAVDGQRARLHVEWRHGKLALNGVAVPMPAPAPAAHAAAPEAQATASGESAAAEPSAPQAAASSDRPAPAAAGEAAPAEAPAEAPAAAAPANADATAPDAGAPESAAAPASAPAVPAAPAP